MVYLYHEQEGAFRTQWVKARYRVGPIIFFIFFLETGRSAYLFTPTTIQFNPIPYPTSSQLFIFFISFSTNLLPKTHKTPFPSFFPLFLSFTLFPSLFAFNQLFLTTAGSATSLTVHFSPALLHLATLSTELEAFIPLCCCRVVRPFNPPPIAT